MELNWSTFVLEIVNFLVLVWILKRFLYQPVLDVIARRREGIARTLADAEAARTEADALKSRYESRVADWNREKQKLRENLDQELDAEKMRRLERLESELEQERRMTRQAEERRRAEESRRLEEEALQQGAQFAARLLREGAGPETEARLVEQAIASMHALAAGQSAPLPPAGSGLNPVAVVTSAFPLADEQRSRIGAAVAALAGSEAPIRFGQDANLLAGLRIAVGDIVLSLNLRDELKDFARAANGGPPVD